MHSNDQRRTEESEAGRCLDAWLRQDLAERYGKVAEEALPGHLLDLLPAE